MTRTARNAASWLAEHGVWLVTWFVNKSIASWRNELQRLSTIRDKQTYIVICVIGGVVLFPYLAYQAFSYGILLGLSFLWSAFLAVSFGYILRNPLMLVLVYVGGVFGRAVMGLIFSGKNSAEQGDLLGAAILIVFGIYLMWWVNRIKTAAILLEDDPPRKRTKRQSKRTGQQRERRTKQQSGRRSA